MLDMWVRLVLLLMLVWLIAEHFQQWGKVWGSQPARYRPTGKKRTAKPKREFQGVTRKPVCVECEAAAGQSPVEPGPPPQLICRKGRRKTVKTDLLIAQMSAAAIMVGWGEVISGATGTPTVFDLSAVGLGTTDNSM